MDYVWYVIIALVLGWSAYWLFRTIRNMIRGKHDGCCGCDGCRGCSGCDIHDNKKDKQSDEKDSDEGESKGDGKINGREQ